MRRSITIASKMSRFVNVQGNFVTAPPPSLIICCWRRAFSGESDDYREILRNGLRDIKLDDAIGFFDEMVQSRPFPSIFEFSELLSTVAKMNKFDVVISLGEKMQKLGISHDHYTYSILVDCFCRSSQLSPALAILGKIIKLGDEPSVVLTLSYLLNGFNASIDAFVKEGKLLEAEKLYKEMIQRYIDPDTVTYNSLINGFCMHDRLDEAKDMLALMVSKSCFPNVVTYNTLIKGFCNSKRIEDGMELLGEMSQRGLMGNTVTYNTLIQGFVQAGKCDYAQEVFELMSSSGVPPNIWTYNILLDGFCGKGLKQEAVALFRKMKEDGTLPDDSTYNTLIRACLRDGDKAASAELIKEMRSCRFAGDDSTFGLVTSMLHDGRLDKSFLNMLS
ncbi:hypothetical protein CARUB_v10021704mg [Capsella rubella]|uniref:Pentacotripeptide-repeat region of PRORP domain-containing protein n=1 Tax=Capsella rubella TaxID=81985 RepID=R0I7W8_9BRAS|nr:pentatricopeptide repeat-containing protein At1g62670, mitochondrial [Capsella rubella]EOA34195.1 hypothetical protein CARUB_v10021704mg [Capsella rubella]